MTTILVVFFLALVLGVITTAMMIKVAWGFGLVDRPDGVRHLHDHPTPRLGGGGIYLAFVIPLLLLFNAQSLTLVATTLHLHLREFTGILVGSTLTLLIGLTDDILDLRPLWKVVWQVLIASVAYAFGFTITAIGTPFGGAIHLGSLAFPVTVLWFLVCMNAVNLLDGHDGLAAGACLFVGLTLFLIGMESANYLAMLLMAALAGALLGFLFFNFPPARIFLGDSGSLLLGFLVASLSLVGVTMKAEAAVSLLIPVIAMGLPFFDTAVAILRRWYAHAPVSVADRGHVHHVLSAAGLSPRRVVLLLYGVSVALCCAAFVLTVVRNEIVILVIGALVIIAFVSMRVFTGLGPAQVIGKFMDDQAKRRQLVKARMSLERAIIRMQGVDDVRQLWIMCSGTFAEVGVNCARMSLSVGVNGISGKELIMRWPDEEQHEQGSRVLDSWLFKMPIFVHGRLVGTVVFENCDCGGNPVMMKELPALLGRMRDGLAFHIGRLIEQGKIQPSGPGVA